MPRTIKNPGVFAADAQTTIPPTPVVGIAYRNAATGLAAIRAGWPFKTIVDSSDFAQILHELTSLTDLIDKTGILEYKDDIDYDLVPAFAVGSDGELYKSTAINGPATTVVDPVGDLTGVWEPGISAPSGIALQTVVPTTSGTSIDLSGIPSGVNRVTVTLENQSFDGNVSLWVQIGDSGGVEVTGYEGTAAIISGSPSAAAFTSAFAFVGDADALNQRGGTIVLTRHSGNTWACDASLGSDSATVAIFKSTGTKTLSGELDTVRLTSNTGVANHDLGSGAISWEF